MVWDSGKPGNAEKIRDLGTVIRPNWEAIEQGDVLGTPMVNSSGVNYLQQYSINLINRTGKAAVDPTPQAETLFAYCKEDGSAVAEGFLMSPAGDSIQLTQDGHLGSTGTDFYMQNFAFSTVADRVFSKANIISAWGYCSAAGALQYGDGVASCSVANTAEYTINFTTAPTSRMATTDYAVVAMTGGDGFCIWDGATKTTSATKIIVYKNGTSATLKAVDFFFIVVGGQ